MGIDYSFNLAVGFTVETSAVMAPFTVKELERSHMEDRFDQKSGKKLASVKVVDSEAGEKYVFEGKDFDDDQYEFLDMLAGKLKCSIANGGGYSNGETLYISVDFDVANDGTDEGRVTCGGSASIKNIAKAIKQAEALKKKLAKLGVKVGEPRVFIQPDIS